MARSATEDVYDKFRFKVTFIDLQPNGLTGSGAGTAFNNTISAGFSEVTVPKVSINTRTYRENIDSPRRIKAAGLVAYEPVTFRRGKVTDNRELYNWLKLVNNDINTISPINDLLAAQNFIPVLPADYRRDVVIQLIDREGVTRRAWFLFNAFPKEYKGGNDFNATDEEKLIEELTIEYEAFVEAEDDTLDKLNEESNEAATTAALAGALAAVLG